VFELGANEVADPDRYLSDLVVKSHRRTSGASTEMRSQEKAADEINEEAHEG
jgi:hypothetical protein